MGFQSTSSMRRMTPRVSVPPLAQLFQSTSSMRRMTKRHNLWGRSRHYFNPHPPCGGWQGLVLTARTRWNFNPHPPCGGWPFSRELALQTPLISIHILHAEDDLITSAIFLYASAFQSTSSMRRMTTWVSVYRGHLGISIHILHAEDDVVQGVFCETAVYFNPHPPCGGWHVLPEFTWYVDDFNPHPPCGGWHSAVSVLPCVIRISIHILHAEDD